VWDLFGVSPWFGLSCASLRMKAVDADALYKLCDTHYSVDMARLEELLASGVIDVDYQDPEFGGTALLEAADHAHDDAVAALVKAGANVTIINAAGWSPLQRVCLHIPDAYGDKAASRAAQLAIVNLLIAADHSTIDYTRTQDGSCALTIAKSADKEAIVRALRAAGAAEDADEAAAWDRLALLRQCAHEDPPPDLPTVRSLLADAAIDVNMKAEQGGFAGSSALLLASLHGHTEAVSALLDCPSTLITDVDDFGRTALHLAAYGGRADVATMLIKRSPALLNACDHDGRTPLALAVSDDNVLTDHGYSYKYHREVVTAVLRAAAAWGVK